jgi:ribose transport system substrate-binding protein
MHRVALRSFLALSAVVALAAAGCGSDSDSNAAAGGKSSSGGGDGGGSKHLLWVQPLRAHPVHKIMQAGFLNECKKLGYSCDVVGNDSAAKVDIPGTVSLAQTAMSKTQYGAVGVYAMDPGLYPLIGQLGKKGIGTVSWHFPLKEGEVPGLSAITGTQPADYAKAAAEALGEQLHGKGTVAVTQGSSNPTENLVAETFAATMKATNPGVKVLKPQMEGFDPSGAVAKASGIIQANQDLAGAFSTTGSGAQTWAGAERQTGKKLQIISMDYVRQNLDLVKKGDVYAIVAQPLYQEGAKTADLLADLAQKKKVSYENWLPAPIVTKSDLDTYYDFLDQAGQ